MKIIYNDGHVDECPADDELHVIRHTAAHILAQAVKHLYPDVKLAIGPAIDNGFYYDVDSPTPITEADLPKIEQKMQELSRNKEQLIRREVLSGGGFGLFLTEPGGGEQLILRQIFPAGAALCLSSIQLVLQLLRFFAFQKREHQRPPSFLPKLMRGSMSTMSTSPKIRPMMPTQAYSSTMPCTMVLSWRCTQVTSSPPIPGMLYRLSM